uniref:acid phosphatase n=1 Tax=Globodera pallida TaxID=36090 RepID=A0A183BM34_GLOPA
MYCQDLYRNELPYPMPEWTQNKTMREEIRKVNCLLDEWTNGKGICAFEGVQFDIELPRIRGGPMLWILIDNMRNKLLDCLLNSVVDSHLCDWIQDKKYFAYSAHDTTIAALFSTLGFSKTNYDVDGYPHYSACVTFELWRNATSLEPYVKVLHWPPDMASFEEVTRNITGCETNCTFARFIERSTIFKPMPSPDEYCKDTHFP